jgi:hypothetical protein
MRQTTSRSFCDTLHLFTLAYWGSIATHKKLNMGNFLTPTIYPVNLNSPRREQPSFSEKPLLDCVSPKWDEINEAATRGRIQAETVQGSTNGGIFDIAFSPLPI